ncbi:MAG: histidine kinase, partial [Oxalobacteraceae bacterium]
MLKSFDIYNQNNVLKIIVAVNLLLVGTGSLLYTNRLIERLESREEQYVQLYAKSIAYLVDPSHTNSGDLTFVTSEILEANSTIPAIYVDPNNDISKPNNITLTAGLSAEETQRELRSIIADMRERHSPVVVEMGTGERGLVYYDNS